MWQIVLNGPGYLDARYELPAGETHLGRAPDNHVVLSGGGISRHHARLVRTDDCLRLEDLGSRNGTRLNGEPVQGVVEVAPGDWIEIGGNRLVVEALRQVSESTTVVLRQPVDEMETIARLRDARRLGGHEALSATAELESLALVYQVSERLANAQSLEGFFDDVAQLVLDLAGAQTVIALLRDESAGAGGPAPRTRNAGGHRFRAAPPPPAPGSIADTDEITAVRWRPGGRGEANARAVGATVGTGDPRARTAVGSVDPGTLSTVAVGSVAADGQPFLPVAIRHLGGLAQGEVPISWGIVESCVLERVSLCVADAGSDPRFAGRESVVLHDVRQVICVPLLQGERIEGVLYVNRLGDAAGLERLVEALTAIAHLAASGIEHQRLRQRAEQESRVRRTLERFLAPDVVDRVVEEHSDEGLGMEERVATVVFADISGFTGLTERIPVQRVVGLLNEFYRRMTEVVFRHRGTVDKFIGDAVMAIFGVPYSYGDDAQEALRAALAMRAAFEDMMESWPADERCALKIGLNTGRLLAGTVGGDRLEYTAVGDTVNVASRLVAAAAGGQILASRSTVDEGGDGFLSNALGDVTLRGRAGPVSVFEVLRERAAASAGSA